MVLHFSIYIHIYIYTDSQLAYDFLHGLSIPTTHLQLLTKIRILLDHLLADIQISLLKIKGHSGHDGNDRADTLAKAGVTSSSHIGRHAYPIRAPLSDTIRVSIPPLFEQFSLEEQATARSRLEGRSTH